VKICVNCKHHIGAGIWYNHYCLAPELERPVGQDPVTGDESHYTTNDLGRVYFGAEHHPNCRDVNTEGKCPSYLTIKPQEMYGVKFVAGQTVRHIPSGTVYEFGYIGGTGMAIVYAPGERNMQDSVAFPLDSLRASLDNPPPA